MFRAGVTTARFGFWSRATIEQAGPTPGSATGSSRWPGPLEVRHQLHSGVDFWINRWPTKTIGVTRGSQLTDERQIDADRQVVGNQLTWMYLRPGETRSCIGCHEEPNTAQLANRFPMAATVSPVQMLPTGGEFTYRAKAWRKGILPDEAEERGRTVRAVSLIGRQ